jgi:cytochrome c biogenesis protein CcmG, thiol:disulfide interchange protein DsbE
MTVDTPKLPSIKSPWTRAALTFALVVVFGYVLVLQGRSRIPEGAEDWGRTPSAGPQVPDVAPAFELPDASGTLHSLDELAGRPVVLNFWASWCPPCLDEMPALQRMSAALADTELAIVAITLDENWADAQGAMAKAGFGDGMLLLQDVDRAVAGSFGTVKVPETYLIDRDRNVIHRFQGAKEWDSEKFIADLRGFVER